MKDHANPSLTEESRHDAIIQVAEHLEAIDYAGSRQRGARDVVTDALAQSVALARLRAAVANLRDLLTYREPTLSDVDGEDLREDVASARDTLRSLFGILGLRGFAE